MSQLDDLRSTYDPDDDDVVRDAAALPPPATGDGEATRLAAPRPVRNGEVVCRSCHLVVASALPPGVDLLVCDDCRW